MFLVLFSNNFLIILALFFMRGAFNALSSGADEAWIVDFLKFKKRKDLIHEYYTKQHSFMSLGIVIAGLAGSLLVSRYDLWVIWPVTSLTIILSALVLFFQSEYFKSKKPLIKKSIKDVLQHSKKSILYVLNDKGVFILLIVGILTYAVAAFTTEITWYPLLQNFGFKTNWFGYLISASFLLEIISPYFIKPLANLIGNYKKYTILCISLQALLLVSIMFIKNWISIALIYSIVMPLGGLYGIGNSIILQNKLPPNMRATISSFFNMIKSLTFAITAPLVGLLVDKTGPTITLLTAGIILIPAITIYLKTKQKFTL